MQNSETIGSVTLASSGAAATANVSGSPYAITASSATGGTFTAGNYNISYGDGSLTVTPRPITLTAANQSRNYGGANPTSGSVSVTSGSLANSDALGTATVAAQNTATATAGAGTTHSLTPSGQTFTSGSAGNYLITYADGTLTINKAHLTVTADDQTRLYGASNPTFTQTFSGFVNGEIASVVSGSATGSTTASAATGVGSATITASATGLSAANYDFPTLVNGTLTINKAHLTVTADDQSRLLGAPDPTFTQTLSGFVNGESLATSGVTGSATGSTTATISTPPGSATILASASGLSAPNYDFPNLVNGTLTITAPADPPPPPPPPPDVLPPPVAAPALNLAPPLPEAPAAGGGGAGGSPGVPANAGGNVTVSLVRPPSLQEAGVVTVMVPREMATVGAGFAFPLPAAVTESAQPSAAISVTTLSGAPLPSWLRFAVDSRTFNATSVPDGAFPMQVLVTIGGSTTTVVISERAE